MATADSCQWDQWESELLQVSSELKQKLLDPHFVAMRCDLDGSGDLDVHELKQAAQVFGTFQSRQKDEERLQALMAGQPRISKERFAEIVAELNQSADFAKPLRSFAEHPRTACFFPKALRRVLPENPLNTDTSTLTLTH